MNINNNNNKKILMLLTNAFNPDPRVHQEAKSLVKHGYDVTLICWDREPKAESRKLKAETIDGIKVERIHVRSTHGRGITQMLFLPIFWLKTLFRVRNRRFDIIHCHDFDTLPLGYIISRLYKYKIIYDSHESFVDMLSLSLPKWLLGIMRATENYLIKRVDLLITVGSLLEEEFQKRGAKNTCLVGNWKRLEDFNISAEEKRNVKKEFGIGDNQLVVSFVGWFSKERRLSELLKAVSGMPEVRLLIGGDGPDKDLVERASKNSLNITYLGYVKPEKIPLYTTVSDAIVYSFDENNPNARFSAPNKLFEALAAGKAVISARFGEIGKIVAEEGCGIMLESTTEDNILNAFRLLRKKNVLDVCQRNAYMAGASKYNWQEAEKVLLTGYGGSNCGLR